MLDSGITHNAVQALSLPIPFESSMESLLQTYALLRRSIPL